MDNVDVVEEETGKMTIENHRKLKLLSCYETIVFDGIIYYDGFVKKL